MDDGQSLYIHIPFCQAKCAYCDFTSYAGLEDLYDSYTAALVQEIERQDPAVLKTIYVGGGTPTLLPSLHLARILAAAQQAFGLVPDAEVTIEANPGTVDAPTLAELRALAVSRLSLGVQSFDDGELRMLGRIHTAAEAIEAFRSARQAGFENVSLDLIYGLPGQSLASWQANLALALTLNPEHLSLYALTVEEGTPLAAAIDRGDLARPDPDLAAEQYESAEEALARAGYLHYEISNWARGAAYQCRHNLTYWRNEPYLGVGAGAHSWHGGHRRANVPSPHEYTRRVLSGETPTGSEEPIDVPLNMAETMILGLRLLEEGVSFERFRERFGLDLGQRFAPELAELTTLGLIERDEQRIRLSGRGHLLGNQVFYRFLPG